MGQIFLPRDEAERTTARATIEATAARLGFDSIAWRTVPTDNATLGPSAVATEPVVMQWFLSARGGNMDAALDLEQQVRRN